MTDNRLLSEDQRRMLLALARNAVAARLSGKPIPQTTKEEAALGQDQGAFVTLHMRGALRGCIGLFEGRGGLAETIQEMAISASFNDPRFPALASLRELGECDFEISVLSPLVKTEADQIRVGLHGVCVSKEMNRGVLLPQVATEQGWNEPTLLSHCCLKAGLPSTAWQDPDTTIECFTAEVFGELEMAGKAEESQE